MCGSADLGTVSVWMRLYIKIPAFLLLDGVVLGAGDSGLFESFR